jgi:hypothetical protein
MPRLCLNWMRRWKVAEGLREHTYARVCTSTLSVPADLSVGLVVTAHTVAEVLAGRASVPAEPPVQGDMGMSNRAELYEK